MIFFRYLSAQSLLGYFDRLGVLDTDRSLEYLGVVGKEEMLELSTISGALNDHIAHLLSYEKYSVYAGITALLCDEISIAQNTVANLSLERDRFTQEMQVCIILTHADLIIPILAENEQPAAELLPNDDFAHYRICTPKSMRCQSKSMASTTSMTLNFNRNCW